MGAVSRLTGFQPKKSLLKLAVQYSSLFLTVDLPCFWFSLSVCGLGGFVGRKGQERGDFT